MSIHFKSLKAHSERTLFEILNQANPQAPRAEQVVWFENLASWLLNSNEVESSARFRYLIQVLDRKTEWAKQSSETLWRLIHESSSLELFVVLPRYQEHSFLGDAKERLFRRLMPGLPKDLDLRDLTGRIFQADRFETFFHAIPLDLLCHLWKSLPEEKDHFKSRLLQSMSQATLLISTRLSAEGLSPFMRERVSMEDLSKNPFFSIRSYFEKLHTDLSKRSDAQALKDLALTCEETMNQCQDLITHVFFDLENSGVSIDIVYRLEGMNAALDRLRFLLPYLTQQDFLNTPERALKLLETLVAEQIKERSLKSWLGNNLHLAARKIVEHSGETGEHYIAHNRAEARKMFLSAVGGGLLTTFTTILKFLIAWAGLPLFPEIIASSLNYAGSFMTMHILGFTLATKQPSMTASTLALKIKEYKISTLPTQVQKKRQELVRLMLAIIRTQLLAAAGNILFVVPGCLLFSFLYKSSTGHHFLNLTNAKYVLNSLHPLLSFTLPFAAWTGVLLWIASLSGGWVDNWAVYRKFFDAVDTSNALQRWLGTRRTLQLSKFLRKNLAAVSVNCTLGFLLALTPVMGKFLGIPLDVRHVTLTSGALSLAVVSVGSQSLLTLEVWMAILSTLLIGVLNFGVSFVLSLILATRAHQVPTQALKPIFLSLWGHLRNGKAFKSPTEDDNT